MGLFGNEPKKQAKKLSPNEWMRWSYGVRVQSNDAARGVVQAEQAGAPADEIAMRLHVSAWEGAAREAAQYYPVDVVRQVFEDPVEEKHAAEGLTECQANMTLQPMFTPEVIDHVKDMVDLARDPGRQRQATVERLQNNYAHINATEAPLLEEMQQLNEIREELTRLGAEPDEELNTRIKREMGIDDTPFNT